MASWTVPENEADHEGRDSVWMWSYAVKDGAGEKAPHFDLISQDGVVVWCVG